MVFIDFGILVSPTSYNSSYPQWESIAESNKKQEAVKSHNHTCHKGMQHIENYCSQPQLVYLTIEYLLVWMHQLCKQLLTNLIICRTFFMNWKFFFFLSVYLCHIFTFLKIKKSRIYLKCCLLFSIFLVRIPILIHFFKNAC